MARIPAPKRKAAAKARPAKPRARGAGPAIAGLPPTLQEREDRSRRMSRAYWALAQCGRALVRAANEEDLLRQLCRILVQVGEYQMAWVGYAIDDPGRSVRPVAQAGFSDGYVETIRVTWADEPRGRGPTGTAIRTGEPFVVRNMRTDPRFEPWREPAAERGFASAAALPIRVGGRVLGALNVYSSRVDAFDPDEVELLVRLTEDLSFGIGAMRDRAERERAERAVAESEELFRTAFEDALVGKALLSSDGRYVRVNRALCRMLGYTREEMLGMRATEPTHPDDRAASDEAIRRVLAGETSTVELEKRYVRKDGGEVDAEVSVSLVRGADGSPRWFIVDVQDVTARRRAEEQLRQSQRMEALTLLAGGIAHDFNNLLTVMLSTSAFALEQAPPGSPLQADIAEFREAAEKAGVVTRQLLAFGRRQVLEPQPVDLGRTVEESSKLLRRILGERVDLRVVRPPRVAPILADPGQVEQVIMNLAVNARDAMPRGGTFTVEIREADDPPEVVLAVADTGTGMDAPTQARVFEPFFTTKPVGKGTGLGLSTVAAIVQRAGGTIDVDTAPGKGTRFEIRFPQMAPEARPRARPAPPAEVTAGGGEVVVVMDDDAYLRRAAARSLRGAGFDVVEAGTLDEAFEGLARRPHPPSVLLTDVRMPTCSGPEAAAALTARFPALRTVYMSGYATEDLADEEAFPAGTAFVQKPFTAAGLVAKIREVAAG